jgi:hypothetical protein
MIARRLDRLHPAPGAGMSPWRWLVFAVMARFDREELYLHLPNSTVVASDQSLGSRAVEGMSHRP